MSATYSGMSRDAGQTVNDLAHIRQSVRDILITPIGSRVMRREYGSLLSALIDQPQTPAVKLQVMSACYMALLRWEPRIKLTGITLESSFDGALVVDITGVIANSNNAFSLNVPVS
ncbi:GPW/gp25 family protein [Brenneria populi]|uniref:GPW/gp25 family protein n=1 Tax=Brenneria populi TaxID=1505588 RepID=A0ABU6JWE0_9GAMM|nr:GPW/gp25 family protein [Brenneria populi Li et al. 2015]